MNINSVVGFENLSNIKKREIIQKNNLYFLKNDTVSFCGKTENEIKISNLENQTAVDFFKDLNTIFPEKCEILLNNEKVLEYCNSNMGIFSDRYKNINIKELEVLKKAIYKIDTDGVDNVIKSLSERNGYENDGKDVINGIVLYANNKKAFDYVINSPVYSSDCYCASGYTKDLCEYLLSNCRTEAIQSVNYNSVIEIEKGLTKDFDNIINSYKNCSDNFKIRMPEEAKELRDYLKNCINENDIIAYRGEKSSWIFDSIPIDKTMALKTKFLVFFHPKSRKDVVFPNNKCYSDTAKQSVYDYIMSKENLTLADAMLAAKYFGYKGFINSVTDKINNVAVEDSNFKSYTLSEDFAKRWAHKKNGELSNDMLSIVTKTNIKKGNQVRYTYDKSQYEFIVNDNPKIITFDNAKFDKDTNTFYIDSQLQIK